MSLWVDRDAPQHGAPEAPYAYIQWKGTDVCLDVHCTCGAELLHYDGYFAYVGHRNLLDFGRQSLVPGFQIVSAGRQIGN